MRIGFFTDSYLPRADGIATSVEAYRSGLTERGHEVFVFCPDHPKSFTESASRIYRFKSIPSISYDNYRDTFPFFPHHRKYIRSLKLDIIHTFTQAQIGILGTFIAKKDHIPLVTTLNTDLDLVHEYHRLVFASFFICMATSIATKHMISFRELKLLSTSKDPLSQRIIKVAAAFYFNQCDLVTVTSIKMMKALDTYIEKSPVLLPLGTNLQFVPENPDIVQIRNRYALPQKITLFVTSSRLVKEKRIDFLIRSFATLPPEDKALSALVIVGDGDQTARLKRLVRSLYLNGKVFFTGTVNHREVFRLVAACDIFVHASLRETQGLVLNEAAACGKPLIMIDREVNPIVQEGKNGFFSSDSIIDFSNKMRKLLHDKKLCQAFGNTSKIRAKKTSQENVSEQLANLYASLLEEKKFRQQVFHQ